MAGVTAVYKAEQAIKIILQKLKSGHSWEIQVSGPDLADVLPKLREADRKMRQEFGGANK